MAGLKKKALKIDPVLCGLGRALEVRCGELVYKWTVKDKVLLYSSTNGKKLFCLKTECKPISEDRLTQCISGNRLQVSKGVKLYSDWTNFDSSNGSIIAHPRGFLFNVGRATAILYASDKWSGRIKHYIHDFKTLPTVWVNKKTSPTVVILSGGKISVKPEGITG